jgi:hypothetical protein
MIWTLVTLNLLWWSLSPISSLAEPLVGADLILPRDSAAVLPPVAGIPYDEASRIVARHQEELMRLPGVQGISLGPEGILIHTEVPTALPATIEGLPVKALPPLSASQPPSLDQAPEENSAPETQQGSSLPPPVSSESTLPPIAGIPYEEAVAIANRHREELMRLPGIYFVGVGDGGLILG